MIKYDYVIERDEKDEVKTYTPSFPKELDNLVRIEGPNSKGKSTLLHLLALSCHGLDNKEINKSLRDKIQNLIGSDHQKVSFKIEITNKDGQVELSSEKPSLNEADFVLRDGQGKIVTGDRFKKQYKLIYDIPDRPLERLAELLVETRRTQEWFEGRITNLRDALIKVTREIEEAHNPEKIAKRKNEIAALEKNKQNAEAQVVSYEERLSQIRLYAAIKYYTHYKQRVDQEKATIASIKKEGSSKKTKKKKITKEFDTLSKTLEDEIQALERLYAEVTPSLEAFYAQSSERGRLALWKEAVVREELASPDLKKKLVHEGSHFRELLDKTYKEESKDASLQEAKVIRELRNFLKTYENTRVKIPAADLEISKFIAALDESLQRSNKVLARVESLKNTRDSLDRILKQRQLITDVLIPQLKAKAQEEEDIAGSIDDGIDEYKIEKLNERLSRYEKLMDYYKVECFSLDIQEDDIDSFYPSVVLGPLSQELGSYSDDELKDKIARLQDKLSKRRREIELWKASLIDLREELEELEGKDQHSLCNHLGFLEKTKDTIQQMLEKINTYNVYIKQLIAEQFKLTNDAVEKKQYYDRVSEYLGSRLGFIKHIDREYEVSKVDLIKREIITTTGKHIHKEDMGTGQSQSAYLKSLLNAHDGKKIIALFDEVAMMDKESLAPIFEKLVELYNNGQLLVGIVVNMNDDVVVTSIGCG